VVGGAIVSDIPRIYANQITLAVGPRDAVIGADYAHPTLVGDTTHTPERVAEIALPRDALEDLRRQIGELLG
jgi:hypothetical protein